MVNWLLTMISIPRNEISLMLIKLVEFLKLSIFEASESVSETLDLIS